MSRCILALHLVLGALLAPADPAGAGTAARGVLVVRPHPSPARPGAAEPNLAVGVDGTVWLSWLEPGARGGRALRAAKLAGAGWSRPITIAEGDSLVANWADFPALLAISRERLAASWMLQVGGEVAAGDIRLAQTHDGGATWSRAACPHRDASPAERGFVSLLEQGEGVRVFWLDAREMAEHSDGAAGHERGAAMSLRTAVVDPDGGLSEEALLDARVCDCCQTAAVRTARGALVAYRDRSPDEIRDISLLRLEGGRWTEPYALRFDGWKIPGCPVNGPSLDAFVDRVVAAWYTGAGDSGRVLAAFSEDGGATFGEPARVDEGAPLGRVEVALLEDGSALVSWVEAPGKAARIRARRMAGDGSLEPAQTIARISATRASGFPRMARSRDRVVFAWTEVGKPSRVRTAVAGLGPGAGKFQR